MNALHLLSRIPAARSTLLLAALVMAGCSERSAITDPALLLAATPMQNVMQADTTAGGIATRYAARFENGQLQQIAEIRRPDGGSAAKAVYDFYGARLVQYQGTALGLALEIELRFDRQGALVSSSSEKIEGSEIAAIRDRAQLLRNLALAKRSTQQHMGGMPQ